MKNFLMKISKPIIVPITRFILKYHYKSDKKLSEIGQANRIIVLAPHMDDETIGAGGAIRRHAENGCHITCVMVTDGSNSVSSLSKEELTAARKSEMNKLKDILGINEVFYLNQPDGQVKSDALVQRKLAEIIQEVQPDIIYSTPMVDAHSDHISTGRILSDVLKSLDKNYLLRLYEINCPIPPQEINCILDISGTMKDKIKAIDVFKSQTIVFDGFLELNQLKTNLVSGEKVKFVETFLELKSDNYTEQFDRLNPESQHFPQMFKQVNKTVTLLWAVFKNFRLKKEIYAKRLANK